MDVRWMLRIGKRNATRQTMRATLVSLAIASLLGVTGPAFAADPNAPVWGLYASTILSSPLPPWQHPCWITYTVSEVSSPRVVANPTNLIPIPPFVGVPWRVATLGQKRFGMYLDDEPDGVVKFISCREFRRLEAEGRNPQNIPPGGGGPPHSPMEPGVNRPGGDYRSFESAQPWPENCQKACANESQCRAWTYVKPGVQAQKAMCWLKSSVPPAKNDSCCVSGVKGAAAVGPSPRPPVVTPPPPPPSPPVTPPPPVTGGAIEQGVNRPGGDLRPPGGIELPQPWPEVCQQKCLDEPRCRAWTYVKPGVQSQKAMCWLKGSVPNPIPDPVAVSGVKGAAAVGPPPRPPVVIPPPPPSPTKTFTNPTVNGVPLDNCLNWGSSCGGQSAADALCRREGYARAASFKGVKNRPPTRTIADNKDCRQYFCGPLVEVVCAR